MLKPLAYLAVGLALLLTPAKADECISTDSFVSAFHSEGIDLLGSRADATVKMAEVFNRNRAASGAPKAEISIFLAGLVMRDGAPSVVVAVVDKNDCVVTKSVAILSMQEFVKFMTVSGVTINDFVPFMDA